MTAAVLSTRDYTMTISERLNAVYAGCAKAVAMVAGCNPRTAENWLQARNAPDGPHLIALMADSQELTAEVLRLAGRADLADVQRRAAALEKISAALKEIE